MSMSHAIGAGFALSFEPPQVESDLFKGVLSD